MAKTTTPKAEKGSKSETPKAEKTAKAPKAETPKATVEKVAPKKTAKAESKEKVLTDRVSGTHRVNFMPNGTNPKLGEKMLRPSASVAQEMVDKGFGNIVE